MDNITRTEIEKNIDILEDDIASIIWHFRENSGQPQEEASVTQGVAGRVRKVAFQEKGGIRGILESQGRVPRADDLSGKSVQSVRH